MSTNHTITTPTWADLATTFLRRMRVDMACREQSDPSQPIKLDQVLARLTGAEDANAPAIADTSSPDLAVTELDPGQDLPTLASGPLLLALRLVATLGSEAGYARMLAPRATTLITGLAPGEGATILDLLRSGGLPADWKTVDADEFRPLQPSCLVTHRVAESNGPQSDTEAARFHHLLGKVLEAEEPVLVLVPATARLPQGLRAAGHTCHLAAPDRQIILRALQEQFGDAGGVDLGQILPADQHLRRLDTASVLLALREPDAQAAARRLAQMVRVPDGHLRLRDLVGYGEARDAGIGIIEDLAAWQRGALPWSDICHGLLLCGPPGVGKTELARAMARDGDVAFIGTSYADWQAQGHLGNLLAAMQQSFTEAQRAAPAILFIDELDAFESRTGARADRASRGQNGSYDTKAIAGLLQQLDGISGHEGVVVIAACNHPDHLDPAIKRAGRFDRILQIDPPGPTDLAVILRQHLGTDLPDLDLARLCAHAVGKTGADCAAAVRVARSAARQQRRAMVERDLSDALLGPATALAPALLWRAAVHEAGHAIMHMATGIGTPVSLSLTRSGGQCLASARDHEPTPDHFRRLCMTHLAGRAAERLVLGSMSAGAGGSSRSDIAAATRVVLAEVVSFGLGTLGPIWLTDSPDPGLIPSLPADVQQTIRIRLADAETAATRVLAANKPSLLKIAHSLREAQRLDGTDLEALLAPVVPMAMEAATAEVPLCAVSSDAIPIETCAETIEESSHPEPIAAPR